MGNKIQNPSAGNVFFNTSGSAISAQPSVDKGRGQNGGSVSATGMSSTNLGAEIATVDVVSTANHGVVVQAKASTVAYSAAANASGNLDITATAHGVSVGDVIHLANATGTDYDGFYKVLSVPDANSIVVRGTYVATGTGTITKYTGSIARQEAGKYIGVNITSEVNGVATRAVGAGSDFGQRRPIHKIEAVRTVKTATAIRNGYWDVYSGSWTTAPTESNDWGNGWRSEGTGTLDEAANPTRTKPGELVYDDGSAAPKLADYNTYSG